MIQEHSWQNLNWNEVQVEAEKLFKKYSQLSKVLEALYQQQMASGFLTKELLQFIHHRKSIESPKKNGLFVLQFNPPRAHRGLSEKPITKSKHQIAFKGGIPCFCCIENIKTGWPLERGFTHKIQKTPLLFLPNTAPIFDYHFTIATLEHTPMKIDVPLILNLCESLKDYWVIENDNGAGASNPEHFHLQAFRDELPIDSDLLPLKKINHTGPKKLTISKVEHPATVYKFEFPSLEKNIVDFIDTLVKKYLTENNKHRLNVLAKSDTTTRLYLALRSTEYRTNYYKTGQPGYAEIGGIISTIDEKRHKEWEDHAWEYYSKLLGDVAVSTKETTLFEGYL